MKENKQSNNENHKDDLLDRVAAAKYLGGISAGTLAVWDCTKRHDLKPIKVGRLGSITNT